MQFNKIKSRWLQDGLLHFYWKVIVRPYFKYIVATVVLMLCHAFFEMSLIGMGIPLIEAILHGGEYSSNPITVFVSNILAAMGMPVINKTLTLMIAFLMGIVVVLRAGFKITFGYWLNVVAQLLKKETRLKLLQKISTARFEYLTNQSRGSVIYDVSHPPQSMHQIVVYLGGFISNLLTVLFLVGMMIYLSPLSTLFMCAMGFGWLLFWRKFLTRKIIKHSQKMYELNQLLSKIDVDFIDGIRVVKSNFLGPALLNKQKGILAKELHSRKRLTLLVQGLNFMNEMAGAVVLVLLGTVIYLFGWIPISFSKFAVLMVALKRVSPSLTAVGQAYMDLAKEFKNVQILDYIFTQVPQEESGSLPMNSVARIQFEHVYFNYPGKNNNSWGLEDIHFSMRKGQVVALAGPSGAGKTTIVNLLMRFYQPSQGGIFADGHPLSQLSLEQWRQKIGYVSQDIFLFNESIWQNVVLWNPSIVEKQVIQSLEEAQLYDFVKELPEGWNTVIGDRGIKLSGGQCQRLAIARAILRKPEILILDEATSALDNLTEQAVYQAITYLRQNASILVVAHRLNTIREADHILVLENGKIIERGDHPYLLSQQSFYAHLYQGDERTKGIT